MDYGPDWPPVPEPEHRERPSRTARDTLRYALAILAAGVTLVTLVIAYDVATAHGLFGHLPTMPCRL